MSSHVKIAGGLLLLGSLALAGYWLWHEKKVENGFFQTSDAAETKDKIRIAVDSWVGYYPLCSAGMKRRLREIGYSLECVDDGADYSARMQALARGDYDFAVATVDSYVVNGPAVQFPAAIVAVLDESKGGDALIARKTTYASLDDLKNKSPKIALTPNSPSEYLAKSLSVHFDIPSLAKTRQWRVDASGSTQALKWLQDETVDAAVLWEPDVTRALSDPTYHRLIGTEQTQRLIVDVLLAQRDRITQQPEKINALLQQYFHVLKQYRDDAALFESELASHTGLDEQEVRAMINGVKWITLSENAEQWLAHTADVSSQEALISTIESVVTVLKSYGDIDESPLPEHDAYRLLNSSFVHALYQQTEAGAFTGSKATVNDSNDYPELTPAQWSALREIGTLKMRPIGFASGSDALTLDDKALLDEIAENLMHYPRFRIEVRGHSGLRGDAESNRELSQSRADAVARYLELTHALAPARMRAIGLGGDKPLPRLSDESERAYNYRLPRVEIVLLGMSL